MNHSHEAYRHQVMAALESLPVADPTWRNLWQVLTLEPESQAVWAQHAPGLQQRIQSFDPADTLDGDAVLAELRARVAEAGNPK